MPILRFENMSEYHSQGASVMANKYLYRYDSLDKLREQRVDLADPFLRGRRSIGNEAVNPHHQVITEMKTMADGYSVYRLSFWKSWPALLLNIWSGSTKNAIQRIPEDHPALIHFKRDHDQYLKDTAWFFWNAMPTNTVKPNWSPEGIPHEVIEVLHPDGRWLPMSQVPCLNDLILDGWKSYRIEGGYKENILQVDVRNGVGDDKSVVMVRQLNNWAASLTNTPELLSKLIELIVIDFALSPNDARWFYSVEATDTICIEEFYPIAYKPKVGTMERLANFFNNVMVPEIIKVESRTRILPDGEIESLYERFDLKEFLLRGEKWAYKHLIQTYEERQELEAKIAAV